MAGIPFVERVGRRLGVGDTPPAPSAQASMAPPGPDAPHAAAPLAAWLMGVRLRAVLARGPRR
jgi:hypothetical protein